LEVEEMILREAGAGASIQARPPAGGSTSEQRAEALIAASRGPGGVDIAHLAGALRGLDTRDPATATTRAAVEARLSRVEQGQLGAALATRPGGMGPDVTVTLKDGTRVTADRDSSSPAGRTLAELRDSADPKHRALFRSVMRTYGSIPAAEAVLFATPAAASASPATSGGVAVPLEASPAPAARPRPATVSSAPDAEGVGSFFEGVAQGDFSDNDSWSKIAGQVVTGFVPIAGQIADARDIAANVGHVWNGRSGGWVGLGTAMIGVVPGVGDAAKAALRGGGKTAEAGVEVAEQVTKNADEAAQAAGAVRTATVGRNRVEWTLDAQGRPTSVTATLSELQPKGAPRGADELAAQDAVRGRGLADDDAGHVIGHWFMGDQGPGNMFPQNFNFNRSAYKTMENEWAAWIEHGGTVRTRVELIGGTADRPAQVGVLYEVFDGAGKRVFRNQAEFDNVANQTFDRLPTAEVRQRLGR